MFGVVPPEEAKGLVAVTDVTDDPPVVLRTPPVNKRPEPIVTAVSAPELP